jgi:hypothetical protein
MVAISRYGIFKGNVEITWSVKFKPTKWWIAGRVPLVLSWFYGNIRTYCVTWAPSRCHRHSSCSDKVTSCDIGLIHGRAVAQAVSRRLPTAVARVRAQVMSWGICGGQSGTEAGFLRVFRFPLPIIIPPTAPHSSSIIRGWYNRPVSGRRNKWTQSHPAPKNYKII